MSFWDIVLTGILIAIGIFYIAMMFHEPYLERRYRKMSDKNQVNPYDTGVATPFPDQAKKVVKWYHNNRVDSVLEPENNKLGLTDIYVVSFTYVLGNWKALVSTTRADGLYYEVTFNREKQEAYVDKYEKKDNLRLTGVDLAAILDL
jgi:hypothetical protein